MISKHRRYWVAYVTASNVVGSTCIVMSGPVKDMRSIDSMAKLIERDFTHEPTSVTAWQRFEAGRWER